MILEDIVPIIQMIKGLRRYPVNTSCAKNLIPSQPATIIITCLGIINNKYSLPENGQPHWQKNIFGQRPVGLGSCTWQ